MSMSFTAVVVSMLRSLGVAGVVPLKGVFFVRMLAVHDVVWYDTMYQFADKLDACNAQDEAADHDPGCTFR